MIPWALPASLSLSINISFSPVSRHAQLSNLLLLLCFFFISLSLSSILMETYGVLRWVMNSVIRKKGSTGFSSSSATSMVNNKCGDDYFYTTGDYQKNKKKEKVMKTTTSFQMPLHYPRYKKADYEKMEEWKLDILFTQYGLNFKGTLDEKRSFAMGAFLWPDQL